MQGAMLNVYGMGMIATEPTEKSIGNARYFKVMLGQYPPEESKRQRDLLWVDLKARDQQRPPRKGDIVVIASGTYDVGIQRTQEGETKKYHTLTAFVWRLLPTGSDSRGSDEQNDNEPAETTSTPAPKPQTESAATPPPDVPDSTTIPF